MRGGAPRCGFISRSCAVAVAGIKAPEMNARLQKGGGFYGYADWLLLVSLLVGNVYRTGCASPAVKPAGMLAVWRLLWVQVSVTEFGKGCHFSAAVGRSTKGVMGIRKSGWANYAFLYRHGGGGVQCSLTAA